MEMHHKLRRDPTWHPNGCNLCGVLGHQASVCPNGTVNWREKYGGKEPGEEQEERWRSHFTAVPATYASEDPSCSFGGGWRRHADEDGREEGKPARKGGYRVPTTPARAAASDLKSLEEAARAWARERKESGAAESEPIPPPRREKRVEQQQPPPGMMMAGPPPPFYPGIPPPMQPGMPPPGYYGGPPPPQAATARPPPPQWQQQQQPAPAPAAQPKRPAAPGSPPPAGWGKAVDSKGRTYYWNKKDKTKVSWKKPEPTE